MNFEELCLDPRIFRAVTEMGFEQASPIQAKAIPVAGLVISGAVGFAATEAVGRAAIEYFEAGGSAAGVANVAKRAAGEADALDAGDFARFLRIAEQSGHSSYMYLQNIYCALHPKEQAVAIALAAAEDALAGEGMCRVHGGGFAGTIQAFVPLARLDAFRERMEETLGKGRCMVLSIRPEGGVVLVD